MEEAIDIMIKKEMRPRAASKRQRRPVLTGRFYWLIKRD